MGAIHLTTADFKQRVSDIDAGGDWKFLGDKPALIDFYAPWCGPCKREVPFIKAAYDKFHGKDFDVLSLAVWERESQKVSIDTAGELGMNWLHINNCGSVPTDIYGVEGIPHLMLIGPDGTILARDLRGHDIETEIAKYL